MEQQVWWVRYGLGGGFGGAGDWVPMGDECDEDEAWAAAHEMALQEYDSYAGSHGLRMHSDIMEEDGVDEDEADVIYSEEADSWLDYAARAFPVGFDPNEEGVD